MRTAAGAPTIADRARPAGAIPGRGALGPRQSGKTTLARDIARGRRSVYLDLEAPADRAKLSNAALYIADRTDKLAVLDEVQRAPELFQALRGLIDEGRRRGAGAGRFLLLGSASMDLLRQSGESLAGRIAYVELAPFDALEVDRDASERLWIRGGFPDSFLAASDEASAVWRENFIRTYLGATSRYWGRASRRKPCAVSGPYSPTAKGRR